jgi:O-antigen/teichoic acid export membrane protein
MIKKQLISGTIWSLFGIIIVMLITFFSNIWLANLLSPKEYGLFGVVMFFIMLCNVIVEGGMSGALIRKEKPSNEDFSTLFLCNLFVSILCFLILILVSSSISEFYNEPLLEDLIIYSSFILIIQSFQFSLNVRMLIEMRFKRRQLYRFFAVLFSSFLAIFFAYLGGGIWSLVLQQILNVLFYTLSLFLFERSHEMFVFRFSKTSFNELYGFGINTTLSSILNKASDNIYQLVLGRYFSLLQVGYFYQAKKIQDVPGSILNNLVQGVFFSSLSRIQGNSIVFSETYNRVSRFFLVTLGFISCLIFIYSESFILLLYGEKWLGVVYYMKLLSIASFFYYQELINRLIFKIYDKTKRILYLEIFKFFLHLLIIIYGVTNSRIDYLVIGFTINCMISYFLSYYYSRKVLFSFSFYDTFLLIKIVFISVFTCFSTVSFLAFLKLDCFFEFLFVPVILIIYLLLVDFFNILNVKKEFFSIYNSF